MFMFLFLNRPDVRAWVLAVRVSIQVLNEGWWTSTKGWVLVVRSDIEDFSRSLRFNKQIYVRRWVVCSLGSSHQEGYLLGRYLLPWLSGHSWNKWDGNDFVVTWMAMCKISANNKVPIKSVIYQKKNQSIVLEHETGMATMSFGLLVIILDNKTAMFFST